MPAKISIPGRRVKTFQKKEAKKPFKTAPNRPPKQARREPEDKPRESQQPAKMTTSEKTVRIIPRKGKGGDCRRGLGWKAGSCPAERGYWRLDKWMFAAPASLAWSNTFTTSPWEEALSAWIITGRLFFCLSRRLTTARTPRTPISLPL